jgi:dienelactone hydrolase
LTKRLVATTRWLESLPEISGCTLGYFGASTGAASALHASSIFPSIKAVVSRGGRPDLASDALTSVTAPTLLIVGSRDEHVLQLNWQAYEILRCIKKVEIVPGATHHFEEAGALDQVCQMAGSWFEKYL